MQSCAALCASAPQTPVKSREKRVFFQTAHIASVLIRPPERLIRPAVTPRVRNAKTPLISAIASAYGRPSEPAANIVTMFESPGLAPGGRPGIGGSMPSSRVSTSASAPSRPQTAIFLDFPDMACFPFPRCVCAVSRSWRPPRRPRRRRRCGC